MGVFVATGVSPGLGVLVEVGVSVTAGGLCVAVGNTFRVAVGVRVARTRNRNGDIGVKLTGVLVADERMVICVGVADIGVGISVAVDVGVACGVGESIGLSTPDSSVPGGGGHRHTGVMTNGTCSKTRRMSGRGGLPGRNLLIRTAVANVTEIRTLPTAADTSA